MLARCVPAAAVLGQGVHDAGPAGAVADVGVGEVAVEGFKRYRPVGAPGRAHTRGSAILDPVVVDPLGRAQLLGAAVDADAQCVEPGGSAGNEGVVGWPNH